jgi:hypothetical protein
MAPTIGNRPAIGYPQFAFLRSLQTTQRRQLLQAPAQTTDALKKVIGTGFDGLKVAGPRTAQPLSGPPPDLLSRLLGTMAQSLKASDGRNLDKSLQGINAQPATSTLESGAQVTPPPLQRRYDRGIELLGELMQQLQQAMEQPPAEGGDGETPPGTGGSPTAAFAALAVPAPASASASAANSGAALPPTAAPARPPPTATAMPPTTATTATAMPGASDPRPATGAIVAQLLGLSERYRVDPELKRALDVIALKSGTVGSFVASNPELAAVAAQIRGSNVTGRTLAQQAGQGNRYGADIEVRQQFDLLALQQQKAAGEAALGRLRFPQSYPGNTTGFPGANDTRKPTGAILAQLLGKTAAYERNPQFRATLDALALGAEKVADLVRANPNLQQLGAAFAADQVSGSKLAQESGMGAQYASDPATKQKFDELAARKSQQELDVLAGSVQAAQSASGSAPAGRPITSRSPAPPARAPATGTTTGTSTTATSTTTGTTAATGDLTGAGLDFRNFSAMYQGGSVTGERLAREAGGDLAAKYGNDPEVTQKFDMLALQKRMAMQQELLDMMSKLMTAQHDMNKALIGAWRV